MALSQASLQNKIETYMSAQGIVLVGPHAWASKLAAAIAMAVVEEIQQNSEVVVPGGGSYGGSTTKVQ